MRKVFVHEVRVRLGSGADPAAVGGAITQALCGDWDHQPPCEFPHHTSTTDQDGVLVARTVVSSPRRRERFVRRLIDVRLSTGIITGPDGQVSTWQHMHSRSVRPTPDEASLGKRLL